MSTLLLHPGRPRPVVINIVAGACLLILVKEKQLSPQEEVSQKRTSLFKGLGMEKREKSLKKNSLSLFLISLGIGFILSQIKSIKF